MSFAAANALRRLLVTRARCFKACFLDESGRRPTLEGKRVLIDLRDYARLDRHSFIKDNGGAIDPLALARIEGRRELLHRILYHLNLDESQVTELVEAEREN